MASLTVRGPPGSDGVFTTFPPTHIVVEPPPSRFRTDRRPSRFARRFNSVNDIPRLSRGLRPSTVISQIAPSASVPMIVRGCRVVSKPAAIRSTVQSVSSRPVVGRRAEQRFVFGVLSGGDRHLVEHQRREIRTLEDADRAARPAGAAHDLAVDLQEVGRPAGLHPEEAGVDGGNRAGVTRRDGLDALTRRFPGGPADLERHEARIEAEGLHGDRSRRAEQRRIGEPIEQHAVRDLLRPADSGPLRRKGDGKYQQPGNDEPGTKAHPLFDHYSTTVSTPLPCR